MRRTTVWATALSALVLGLANPNVSEAKPSGEVVASAIALTPSSEFSAPTVKVSAREARLVSAIQQTYQFRERGERVRVLQRLLGNLETDGYYGSLTRKAHIEALTARGLPTTHVPAVTYPAGSGPRFPDDPTMRCPKWEAKFREYGLPVEVFSYIAWRESKCNPKAINARWNSQGVMTYALNKNGTWDSGLVQINSSWIRVVREVCGVDTGSMRQDLEALLKVDCNLKMAKWIMDNTSGKLRNWSIYGGN